MEAQPPARIPANEVARAMVRAVIGPFAGGEAGPGNS